MSLWIKVCGVTSPGAARAAAEAGADAVGFVLHAGSPACVSVRAAAALAAELPPRVERVGVFVGATAQQVRAACREAGLTAAQIHGPIDPALREQEGLDWYPAIPLGREVTAGPLLAQIASCGRPRFLLETAGAAGPGRRAETADWNLAAKVSMGLVLGESSARLILAGGLTAGSLPLAVRTVRPWGVDLSLASMDRPAGAAGMAEEAVAGRIAAATRAARLLA